MQKSKLTSRELRTTGELMIQIPGHEDLGYALLELVAYRDQEQKLMARSRFNRTMIAMVDIDVVESKVKSELSRMLADKMVEDRIVRFSQSYDDNTNEIIFHGEVNVLKGD